MGFTNFKKIDQNKLTHRLIFICIIIILYLTFSSCASRKEKAHRYFNENKKELAELCLDKFPIKEKIIKGDTVTIIDTLKVVDKIPVFVDCPDGTKKECPPRETKYIERIRTVTDTIVRIDTRKEAILKHDIKELAEDNKTLKKQRKTLIYISVLLLFLLIVSRILK